MNTLLKLARYVIIAGVVVTLALPLIVDNNFFFPFITTRAFIFRLMVEVMLLAYLFVAIYDESVRPKLNKTGMFLLVFIVIAFVSALINPDLSKNFWGDMERSEGLLLWLHLGVFFFVTSSFIKSRRTWNALLDVSLISAVLVCFYGIAQTTGSEAVLASSGARVDALFGNAAFLATYLLLHLGITAYLFVERKNIWARGYYIILAVLYAWIILATQTRGAALGLAAGILVAGVLLAWRYRQNSKVRTSAIGIIVAVIVFSGILYVSRDSGWVRGNGVLKRLASISIQERTAQTRLATWGAALKGIKEKPVLGWGIENFNVVFNKYFPPVIYEDEGSTVWFDRAHNTVLERATTTGVLGLIAYLGFIFYPAYYLLRKQEQDENGRLLAIVVAATTTAFFVQNLFVFESVVTYMTLFFIWAWWSSQMLPEGFTIKLPVGKTVWMTLTVVWLVVLPFTARATVLYPASINREATAAMRARDDGEEKFFDTVEKFKPILAADTYGRPEYRLNYIEFITLQLANQGEVAESVKPVLRYTENELDSLLRDDPTDAKNWLLAMRYYNLLSGSFPDEEVARLEKSLSYYDELYVLSPTRPQVLQEAGYVYRRLYQIYTEQGDQAAADDAFTKAEDYFRKTVELQPAVVESYMNLLRLYWGSGEDAAALEVIQDMERRAPNYYEVYYLTRLISIAKQYLKYEAINNFASQILEQDPASIEALIDIALSHAYLGERSEAVEIADQIKEFGGQYEQEAQAFIDNVNSGFYEKQAKEQADKQ